MKDWFCTEYRDGEKIRSCDAYYQDSYNNLVIEFKNTHHLRLKEYLNEIRVKFIDTHFILAETFWRNKKVSQMSSSEFYSSMEFIDKKDFMEDYIEAGYFQNLN